MRGKDHYAVLGLHPGAGRAEVDEAYRRLIKLYHPDRMGGDGSRAAEINRAYTMLRQNLPAPVRPSRSVPAAMPPPRRAAGRRRTGWLLISFIVVAGIATVATQSSRSVSSRTAYDGPLPWVNSADSEASTVRLTDFDEPLHTGVIDQAIADAAKFHGSGDLESTLAFSRACHNSLRSKPSLTWFDACAAFDEATLTLNSDSALAESGPFNGTAVIARQIAAARQLSGDPLSADSRLHDIRSRVDLTLLPMIDEAAAPQQRP
jgi:hypothetical protein